MVNEATLPDKWWWRALKAIYVLTWIVAFSLIALIAYSSRPYTVKDDYNVNINCDNSETYKHFLTDSFYGDKPTFTSLEIDQLKRVCAYGLDASPSNPAIINNNFKYSLIYDNYGSWGAVATSIGLGFLISFIIIEGIKSIVLYIVGVSVWRGMLFYGLLFLASIFSGNKKGNKDN